MTRAPAPQGPAAPPLQNLFAGFLPRALGLIAAAMLTGLVFAAWQANGPALLDALAASGLSWCL
ncbi:hypothetical protein [uncultured Hoeflea sp.]|uniref:hypothetical protein n=1 Tax=uncultured Hoeflea sp. TaxID=538666 RepID=UPI0030EB9E3B|tara:strand:+ start:21402 stop:21593 length:192 start_codon:yes stop_codon:yes gene_type:complete